MVSYGNNHIKFWELAPDKRGAAGSLAPTSTAGGDPRVDGSTPTASLSYTTYMLALSVLCTAHVHPVLDVSICYGL